MSVVVADDFIENFVFCRYLVLVCCEELNQAQLTIMGVGDNFVYSKRDLILAGVTVGIIVVTLGLGFGLQKGASLPGTGYSF